MKTYLENYSYITASATQISTAIQQLAPEIKDMFILHTTTGCLTVSNINNSPDNTASQVKEDLKRATIFKTTEALNSQHCRWLVSAEYYGQDYTSPLLVLLANHYKATAMYQAFNAGINDFFNIIAAEYTYATIQIPIQYNNDKFYFKLLTFFHIQGEIIIAIADRYIVKHTNMPGKTTLLFGNERYYFPNNFGRIAMRLFQPFFINLEKWQPVQI